MGCDPAHGWPHIVRVYNLAQEIIHNISEPYNLSVLETAIIFHDVGRFLPGEEHHAIKSSKFARKILLEIDARVDIDAVSHAILAHSYSLGVKPRTIEAAVLSDADKLDALGAVGIARVFHTGCRMNRGFEGSIKHFYEKILNLPDQLVLEYSKEIALKRMKIIIEFINNIKQELMLS